MNQLQTVLPYAMVATALIVGLFLLIGWVLRMMGLRSKKHPDPTEEDITALAYSMEQERVQIEEQEPRCPCGALATHPLPKLVRQRESWLQKFYAMAPQYRRVVPLGYVLIPIFEKEIQPKLEVCETHAHVADSMMDNFIYQDIRAEQAKINEAVAIKSAAFEQEALLKKITESMTDQQKRAVRKVTSLAPVPQLKTANGDNTGTG